MSHTHSEAMASNKKEQSQSCLSCKIAEQEQSSAVSAKNCHRSGSHSKEGLWAPTPVVHTPLYMRASCHRRLIAQSDDPLGTEGLDVNHT